jgi:hypothetical protein
MNNVILLTIFAALCFGGGYFIFNESHGAKHNFQSSDLMTEVVKDYIDLSGQVAKLCNIDEGSCQLAIDGAKKKMPGVEFKNPYAAAPKPKEGPPKAPKQ